MISPTSMIKTIRYDEAMDEFVINLHVPKTQRGTYTYDDDMEWEVDAVCVWIDNSRLEYGLFHTQYLDYKDSLQATSPIIFFDTQEEAERFAKTHSLMIEYGSGHNYLINNDE